MIIKCIENEDYFITKKHFIIFLYVIGKFIFLSFLVGIIYFLAFKYRAVIPYDIKIWLVFPLLLWLLNYTFFKFIFWIINYNNDLVILLRDKVYIIHTTLMLRDDIEMMDMYKIIKVDAVCHWFISNILRYWHIIIEQQGNEKRVLHFIPVPYKLMEKLNQKIDTLRFDKYTWSIKKHSHKVNELL